jgi:hypothetical protein
LIILEREKDEEVALLNFFQEHISKKNYTPLESFPQGYFLTHRDTLSFPRRRVSRLLVTLLLDEKVTKESRKFELLYPKSILQPSCQN